MAIAASLLSPCLEPCIAQGCEHLTWVIGERQEQVIVAICRLAGGLRRLSGHKA